jgi:hypothetical protein
MLGEIYFLAILFCHLFSLSLSLCCDFLAAFACHFFFFVFLFFDREWDLCAWSTSAKRALRPELSSFWFILRIHRPLSYVRRDLSPLLILPHPT